MSLIAGFTAKLQCTVFRCGLERATVQWLKDELIIFNDTEFLASSGLDPGSVILERTASPEYVTKGVCPIFAKIL
uniref:MHC class II antigen n=1 Tax=Acrobeloides nanus TaxID=290746 RepID=A0A914CR10_9BILA